MTRIGTCVLVMVNALASVEFALGAEPAADRPPLQALLDTMRVEQKIRGAAATVVFPDGSVWNGASGQADMQNAVAPGTLFEIGSITKTFTSALVLALAADGALSLDDSLTRWLPDFPHAAGVTVRQLLQHTSGLHNYSENPDYIPALRREFARTWKPEDSFAFMMEPYFAPGAGWHYSNANYLLLGQVCERVGNGPFHALLRARVIDAHGLRSTFFRPDEAVAGPVAHAFIDINNDGTPEDLTALVPLTAFITAAWSAGALVATAEDLARWMRVFCTGAATTPDLFAEQTRWVDRGDGMDYGLGLIRKPRGEDVLYGHKGNTAGYSASAWYSPSHGVAVAVLTNGHAVDVTPIAESLLDLAVSHPEN